MRWPKPRARARASSRLREDGDITVDLDFDFECPECGAKVKTSVAAVAAERTVRCARGHSVKLKDQGRGARGVKRSIDDLDRAIQRLQRTVGG